MEKILNQEEIDALIRAAQNRSLTRTESERKHRRITTYTFGQSGRINQQQVGSVSLLHDSFARNITERLGAYLRVLFEANLVLVEQLSYAEFLQRLPEMSYICSINLQPIEAAAILEVDLSLAFPAVDLLLGGRGKAEPISRDVTEIEEQILESMVMIICEELQLVWQPLIELTMSFEQRQKHAQVQRLMAPNERVLALSFEIRMPEARGTMNLALPAAVSSALLRKISEQSLTRKRRIAREGNAQRRMRLQECRFSVEMALPASPVRGSDLLALQAGQTLVLQHRISDPVLISVANRTMFTAYPARVGKARAAMIDARLQLPPDTQKELL